MGKLKIKKMGEDKPHVLQKGYTVYDFKIEKDAYYLDGHKPPNFYPTKEAAANFLDSISWERGDIIDHFGVKCAIVERKNYRDRNQQTNDYKLEVVGKGIFRTVAARHLKKIDTPLMLKKHSDTQLCRRRSAKSRRRKKEANKKAV